MLIVLLLLLLLFVVVIVTVVTVVVVLVVVFLNSRPLRVIPLDGSREWDDYLHTCLISSRHLIASFHRLITSSSCLIISSPPLFLSSLPLLTSPVLVGLLVFAAVIGQVWSLISTLNEQAEAIRKKKDAFNSFMQ